MPLVIEQPKIFSGANKTFEYVLEKFFDILLNKSTYVHVYFLA